MFGWYSEETACQHQEASGFETKQKELDDCVTKWVPAHKENHHKRLVLLSVPVQQEYLLHKFSLINNALPFTGEVSFKRVINNLVFLYFFVGITPPSHFPLLDIPQGRPII